MSDTPWQRGTVYTETVVHAPPQQYANDARYQLAIVSYADGTRRTVRVEGERVKVGDTVEWLAANEARNGVFYYRKAPQSV